MEGQKNIATGQHTTCKMEGSAVLKVKQVCGAKWSGDVTISLDASTEDLKSKLQQLTGQPVHTMKLMCSGKYVHHIYCFPTCRPIMILLIISVLPPLHVGF
jgi:hypothetical protein